MTTIDQIKKSAIETAMMVADCRHDTDTRKAMRDWFVTAIAAYDAAIEVPISAYVDGTRALFRTDNGIQFVGTGRAVFFGVEGTGRVYLRDQIVSFRPLPQPPEVKP